VEHGDADEHDHARGLFDRSILRSCAGIRAVSWSLGILTVTALAQAYIYSRTLSVALLADLIHNFGDALTAILLGIAFYLRSARGERWRRGRARHLHQRAGRARTVQLRDIRDSPGRDRRELGIPRTLILCRC
jgi:hypothetical protein